MSNLHEAFRVHMLNAQGKEKAYEMAKWFNDLLVHLETMNGSSREMSIVRTKLEEACFFAKKAMAAKPENCE